MDVKIIFGPPGTGKTTHLLNILEKELKENNPAEIAYVSFTKEGAYQGRNRALEKFNYNEDDFPYFRTLHSIAFRELKMKRAQMIDKKDYKLFSDKMGMRFTGYYTEDFRHNDDLYLFFNILNRNNPKIAENYLYLLNIDKLRFVYSNYKKFKDYYKIYDFTDIIENFNERNKALPVKIAIIDEAQDLTTLQWQMIWVAFRKCRTVYVAGDDDQAIYEWSGADVNYFINLKGDIKILDRSYRLPKSILRFTKNISSQIERRIKKDFEATDKEGKVFEIINLAELKITKNETWLFLSRNRYFLDDIEQFLRNKGLIYECRGEHSITNKKINAINLYERIRKTMIMKSSEELTLRLHLKEEYDLRNPWYSSFKWDSNEIIYYRDVVSSKTNTNKCNIKVATIHSVKGSEADNVVVLLDITRQVEKNMFNNPDSEHRVFYVGCTRAKKNLYIKHGLSQFQYKLMEERNEKE